MPRIGFAVTHTLPFSFQMLAVTSARTLAAFSTTKLTEPPSISSHTIVSFAAAIAVRHRFAVALESAGRDLGSLAVLQPYETRHRRETWPVYHGTNAVVGLFTDDSEPARWMREAVIRVADRLPVLKSAITQKLTRRSGFVWPALPRLPTLPLPGRRYQ